MNPYLSANCLNVSAAYCGPLSDIATSGTPWRTKNDFNCSIIGSLEFGHFEESRVIVDRNQVLRVMPVKQVCSNAFPWPLWKLKWHKRFTMLWTIPLTLSTRSDHVCNLHRLARPPDVPSAGLSAFVNAQMTHVYPLEDLCTK